MILQNKSFLIFFISLFILSCLCNFVFRATNNSFIDTKKSLPADLLKLDLSHNHLISLDGLEFCSLLNDVNLEQNQISSFKELSTKLENLVSFVHCCILS